MLGCSSLRLETRRPSGLRRRTFKVRKFAKPVGSAREGSNALSLERKAPKERLKIPLPAFF